MFFDSKYTEQIYYWVSGLKKYVTSKEFDDFMYTIDNIKSSMQNREKNRFKNKFIELVNKICSNKEYSFFILKNDEGLYDIFLVIGRFNIFREDISYERVIKNIVSDKKMCYVVENVDRKNAELFLKALYIYDIFKTPSMSGDTKDLVEDDEKLDFKAVRENGITYNYPTKKPVYYDARILHYSLSDLSLKDVHISSFSEALDVVSYNKHVGTKIITLKP